MSAGIIRFETIEKKGCFNIFGLCVQLIKTISFFFLLYSREISILCGYSTYFNSAYIPYKNVPTVNQLLKNCKYIILNGLEILYLIMVFVQVLEKTLGNFKMLWWIKIPITLCYYQKLLNYK